MSLVIAQNGINRNAWELLRQKLGHFLDRFRIVLHRRLPTEVIHNVARIIDQVNVRVLGLYAMHNVLDRVPWRVTGTIVAPVAGRICRHVRPSLVAATTNPLVTLGTRSRCVIGVKVKVGQVHDDQRRGGGGSSYGRLLRLQWRFGNGVINGELIGELIGFAAIERLEPDAAHPIRVYLCAVPQNVIDSRCRLLDHSRTHRSRVQ